MATVVTRGDREAFTAQDILRYCAVPKLRNVYVLGVRERRVTIKSQQVRALNLVWALHETGRPGLMFRFTGCVDIHLREAVDQFLPLAVSEEYVVELNVPDEQIACAKIIALWRAAGSPATGQAPSAGDVIAQAYIMSEEEVEEATAPTS